MLSLLLLLGGPVLLLFQPIAAAAAAAASNTLAAYKNRLGYFIFLLSGRCTKGRSPLNGQPETRRCGGDPASVTPAAVAAAAATVAAASKNLMGSICLQSNLRLANSPCCSSR